MRVVIDYLDRIPEAPNARVLEHHELDTRSYLRAWCFLGAVIARFPNDDYRESITDEDGRQLQPDAEVGYQARHEARSADRIEEFAQAVVDHMTRHLEPWDDYPPLEVPPRSYWEHAAAWWARTFRGAALDEAAHTALQARYGHVPAVWPGAGCLPGP